MLRLLACELGYDVAINTRDDLTSADFEQIRNLGFDPLVSTSFFEPTPEEVEAERSVIDALQAQGGSHWATMLFSHLQDLATTNQLDWWSHSITTYELDEREQEDFAALLTHFDELREDATAKLARRELHYAETFNGHAPLQTRLMYGLWLYRSKLDGGSVWGYSFWEDQNPYLETGYSGTAFPARVGPAEQLQMLSSYTLEAFRAGIDDLRYALTVERLLSERGSAAQMAEFEMLLTPYDELYADGDRVDYRNRESDVRLTRQRLFELLTELVP